MNYNEFIDSLSSSYRNLLSRLTSASSDFPPGYLYNELVEFVKTDLSKLNEIEEYLINKLSRREPYIKLKCLKLLKHLCIKFPKDFIRPKVTQSQLVLECKSYKSPYSEYSGDSLSKLVRTECEELIKVVCSYDSKANSQFEKEDKMVGFGNNKYNTSNQYGGYSTPGVGNPNYQTPGQFTQNSRNMGGYQNTGMMGFGNPNMPPSQNTTTSALSSFASTFTPTVSELKNAGNNALRMLSNAANKYLPSDFVEKIEKVSSAITSTASEQFEKYLGSKSHMGRSPRNLNNSMYTRTQPSQYQGGIGYNTNPNQQGYGPSPGYGQTSYSPTSYNAVSYTNPQSYTSPQNYNNQPSYNTHQAYTGPQSHPPAQTYAAAQPIDRSPSFSGSRNVSHSAHAQGFGAFPAQGPQQNVTGNLSSTSSLSSYHSQREVSLDLFPPVQPAPKYTLPREKEVAFVKEMLVFTGIKVSPSPRLVDEYLTKMKEMDKNLIVQELLKQLNVRSSKWQTHFRILCILESLLLKGNLDAKTLKEFRNTGVPMINKCKYEPQLANKAEKLISLLSNTTGSLLTEDAPEGFGGDKTDLFKEQKSENKSSEVTSLFETSESDLFSTNLKKEEPKKTADPVDSKVSEFDLFFGDESNPKTSSSTVSQPKQEPKKDLFDFDNLSFDNTSKAVVQRTKVDPAMQPIVSNIDNNLDLFDNTDFGPNMLEKPSDPFSDPQKSKSTSIEQNFELI